MAATAKVRICCFGSFPLFLKIRSDILTLFPILVWKSCCVWKHDAIFSGKLPVRLLVLGKHKAHAPLLKVRSTGLLWAVYGARGGRTLTVSPPTDFKSVASADSAIAPACDILPYFEMLSNREALSLFIMYLLRQSLMMNGM
jgi:hypothetical protein